MSSQPSPPPSPLDDKKLWRGHARNLRKAIAADAPRHTALSEALERRVIASGIWRNAPAVMLYCPVHGEVGTSLLFADARARGVPVFLPRCRPEEPGQMDMLACPAPDALGENGDKALVLSPRGILEPPEGAPALPPDIQKKALVIVPALAFDRRGYRIGYGGGYYDRLLASGVGASLGLVFSALLFDTIPRDPWDIPVTALATEETMLWP